LGVTHKFLSGKAAAAYKAAGMYAFYKEREKIEKDRKLNRKRKAK
jgi:hypothetical protein